MESDTVTRTEAAAIKQTSSTLAIHGGVPVVASGHVMHSRWPRITDEDVEGLTKVFRAGLLTEMSGRAIVRQFEVEMALSVGTRYAFSTNSGTAALHCALAGLGVESGDEVILPALTYISCAAAVVHQHAIPIFADIDTKTFNLRSDAVEAAITPRTRAIMAVHLHGLPADMQTIANIGRRHGIAILEDFPQAFGASYRGRQVGSIGDAGAASLMAGKNLPSAGEAGVMVTNDRAVRNRAATLKCFSECVEADGSYRPLHDTIGYNYRSNILSLVFASQQLFRLDEFNNARIASAERLDATLKEIPGFVAPYVPPETRHVYHMYRFRFDPHLAGFKATADQCREALKRVFWGEGLPLVEFQNVPLPGHALMQGGVGYGSGCPWSCHKRPKVEYRADAYPGALDVIRHSLIVGYPAQASLANEKVVDHYVRCFFKLAENFDAFERYALTLPSEPPWHQPARLF